MSLLYDLSIYFAKSAVVLLFLFAGYRLMGKRQIAQFNLYDLATIMALANAVQNAMTRGKGDLSVGLVCSSSLILVGWGISRLVARIPGSQAFVYGTPTVLVSDGTVLVDHMHKERVTHDELLAAMRGHGLTSVAQVRLAVLEVDGAISIVPVRQHG